MRRRGVRLCVKPGRAAQLRRPLAGSLVRARERESTCDSGRGKKHKKREDKKTDPGKSFIAGDFRHRLARELSGLITHYYNGYWLILLPLTVIVILHSYTYRLIYLNMFKASASEH